MTSSQLQEWLLSGRLDMVIMFDAPSSPMLEVTDLVEESLYLVGAEGAFDDVGPVPLEALASLPMIVACRPNSTRVLLDSELARLGQKLNLVFELDPLDTMFDLARDGFGFTVASIRTMESKGAGAGLAVRKIVGPELVLAIQLVQPARRVNNRLQEAAFRILKDLSLKLLRKSPRIVYRSSRLSPDPNCFAEDRNTSATSSMVPPLATAGTVMRNRSEANPSIRAPSEGLARKSRP